MNILSIRDAITFIYVGVEVTIGSNLGELLKSNVLEPGILSEKEITPYISTKGEFYDWKMDRCNSVFKFQNI